VEKVLFEIGNKPYISESWHVLLEKTEDANMERLYAYWSGSADGDCKDEERMYREFERIENSKIPYPASIRDVLYNSILSLLSIWDPSSAEICVNHSIGTDACTNFNTNDKLKYLFAIWFGKEKLFFQFHYAAGNVCICIM